MIPLGAKFARRSFLGGFASLTGTALLPGCSDSGRVDGGGGEGGAGGRPTSFGPPKDDPDAVLKLPEGFRYVVLEKSGDRMSDGHAMGARPDGMACFEVGDRWVLLRNHENDIGASAEPSVAYNANLAGGVSRVVLDPETLERVSSNWVLVGTNRNCAGGPTPHGWLSCEESVDIGHGYVFLCDPEANEAAKPQRVPSLGRFKHEAVAFDPETRISYLTEDERISALYRHVPEEGPFKGKLEALRVVGEPKRELGSDLSVGDTLDIDWVPISDTEGDPVSTAEQAHEAGAAIVVRGEGIWTHDGLVYFVATEGGPLGKGQVFCLDPGRETLTLIAQAEDEASFVNPDNLTVSPSGEVWVVEDNDGPNRIWRVNQDGTLDHFAENALNGGASEFCGVCFSPDGRVMFVNLQEEGYTLAITGPFGR